MKGSLLPVLDYAKQLLAGVLAPGDSAVDATVGNGHDTLFLAQQVGTAGRVYGFDVQPAALAATRQRLQTAGILDRVQLFQRGHERMAEVVEGAGPVRAVMFNLGYLPGGDKALITRPETTLPALAGALRLLAPGGLLTVVLYPGHPGGQAESEAVLAWARSLDPRTARVLHYAFLNARTPAPSLVAVEKPVAG